LLEDHMQDHEERRCPFGLEMARSLELVPRSPDEVRAMIDAMAPDARAQLSADWLALFEQATAPDPWVHGFVVRHRETGAVIGQGGFKGPPRDGAVEIAYGTEPEHRGRGYATETAAALLEYSFAFEDVRVVLAHTLPDAVASQRVLKKCGFTHVGEEIDPEDGLVWRFEKHR
jgi:RimJ/RimL family protein N-acetyltransferase